MGKASRKLKKKQQLEEAVERQTEAKEIEQKLMSEIEQEAYSDALNTLAELAEKGSVSPAAMYAGAYAYFMLGDYERAASWIDNTLRFAPGHVAARILLARLCILQEKIDAGLSIFELLTDKFLAVMSDEEKDEVESLSGFYGRNEPERIRKEYPHLAIFLRLDEEEEPPKPTESFTARTETTTVQPTPAFVPQAEAQKPAAPEPKQDTGKSALEILRNLKQKIDARKAKKTEEPNPASTASVASQAENVPTPPDSGKTAVPDEPSRAEETDEARRKLREVLDSPNSIADKVRVLNSFAGGYYAQDNLEAAELFLTEALKFDETDDGLLRNLAVLLAEKGEKDKAFQAAARMRHADFLLIQAIREM